MIYIILGMHKSGTTLIAEMLHKSGINMVDSYNPDLSYGHLMGKMERQSVLEINHQILKSKEISSLDIESVSLVDFAINKSMKMIIDQCQINYPKWGFKDPRTCLTYSLWKNILPEHKLIVVYRNPVKVINHYAKHFGFLKKYSQLIKSIAVYNKYNSEILKIIDNCRYPYHVFAYEDIISDPKAMDKLSLFIDEKVFDARIFNNGSKKSLNDPFLWLFNFYTKKKTIEVYKKLEKLKS